MPREPRQDRPGAWYHVFNRGIEKRPIFRSCRCYERFLELFSDLPQRFGIKIHAYVLMPNHYHLQLETSEANLSRAIQWLNVSYSVWFNRKHNRVGPLFQGRFKSRPHAPSAALMVSSYIHLNPARLAVLGGNESTFAPDTQITEKQRQNRLATMEQHPWSSYPYFAGHKPAPEWLDVDPILKLVGQGSRRKCQEFVRQELRRVAALGEPETDSLCTSW